MTFVAGPSYHVEHRTRFPWTRQSRRHVNIIRTWGTKLPKAHLSMRMLNLASYYSLAALACLGLSRPDLIVANTDPPLLGALGTALKKKWGCQLVYNVRDLFPDIAYVNGGVKSSLLLKLLEKANQSAFRNADLVVVLGRDMASRVAAKDVPKAKIAVIPDWVDCAKIVPPVSNEFRADFGDKFVVMYSGNLGLSQQLETVLDTAERFREDARVVFAMIGEGARKKWLQAQACERNLTNVRFYTYRPKDKLTESLSAADIHLVPMAPGAIGCMVPSKLYGILAVGRPFIAMMEPMAEVAQLAIEHSVGFVTAPGDSVVLENAIKAALARPTELKRMGERARRLAEERFDRKIVTRQYSEMLESVYAKVNVCKP
ncbi:MAG: glycosyltransferase family 4 protein [Candidatus Binataceae bacterium]